MASWHQHWGWQALRSLVPQPPVVESYRGWSTCLWGVHYREQGTGTGVRSPYPHTRPPISTKSLPSLDRFAYTMHFFSSFCIHLTRQEQNQGRKKSASCRMRLNISKWWSGFRQQTTRLNKLQQRKLHGLDWYFISRQHGACIYISFADHQGPHRGLTAGRQAQALPSPLSLTRSALPWWHLPHWQRGGLRCGSRSRLRRPRIFFLSFSSFPVLSSACPSVLPSLIAGAIMEVGSGHGGQGDSLHRYSTSVLGRPRAPHRSSRLRSIRSENSSYLGEGGSTRSARLATDLGPGPGPADPPSLPGAVAPDARGGGVPGLPAGIPTPLSMLPTSPTR